MATTAGCNPNTRQFDLSAAGGNIRANLRSREVQGLGGSHLYIEYMDQACNLPDFLTAICSARRTRSGRRTKTRGGGNEERNQDSYEAINWSKKISLVAVPVAVLLARLWIRRETEKKSDARPS